MDTMKSCFQEHKRRNLTTKIGPLSRIVLSRRSAKKIAHHSIFARYFCKDQRKFACFGTFGGKRACLIMKKFKNPKFDPY